MEKLRSLQNYKEMHKDKAREKGVLAELQACSTLTAARKILFGEKPKQYVARRDDAKKK